MGGAIAARSPAPYSVQMRPDEQLVNRYLETARRRGFLARSEVNTRTREFRHASKAEPGSSSGNTSNWDSAYRTHRPHPLSGGLSNNDLFKALAPF